MVNFVSRICTTLMIVYFVSSKQHFFPGQTYSLMSLSHTHIHTHTHARAHTHTHTPPPPKNSDNTNLDTLNPCLYSKQILNTTACLSSVMVKAAGRKDSDLVLDKIRPISDGQAPICRTGARFSDLLSFQLVLQS